MATFKAKLKSYGSNIKTSVKNTYSRAKSSVKEYSGKVNSAYNVGYLSGVDDYSLIPKTFGAQSSATYGYSRGLKDTHKNYKYQNKLKKKGR